MQSIRSASTQSPIKYKRKDIYSIYQREFIDTDAMIDST